MFILSLLSDPVTFVFFIVALIITVSIHEFAHAYTADRLGDPTPSLAGRLTLNPKAHLDPMGSILFLLVGFGWGKPVPFDPFNLKDPRRDAAIISLAGPGSNAIAALTAAVLMRMLMFVGIPVLSDLLLFFLAWFIRLNVILGLFNLLPFGPLDGFKIVGGILPKKQAREWYGLERYGLILLLFFIFPFVGNRSMLDILIIPVINFFTGLLIP